MRKTDYLICDAATTAIASANRHHDIQRYLQINRKRNRITKPFVIQTCAAEMRTVTGCRGMWAQVVGTAAAGSIRKSM
jgi:hypothetical protein